MKNVIDNKKDLDGYKKLFFTEKGYKMLHNYSCHLAQLYIQKTKEADYPFGIGCVLGLPTFKFANVFITRQDLYSRLKAYAQLLGKTQLSFKKGDATFIVDFTGGKNGK